MKRIALFLLLLALALVLAGPAPRPAAADAAPALEKRLARAIAEGKADEAQAAIAELSELGSRAAVEALLEAGAKVEDYGIYAKVVGGLARVEKPEGIEALCRRLRTGSDLRQRSVAAIACRDRRDEATLLALLDAIDTPHIGLRRAVLRGLVVRRDRRAVEPLIDLLEKHEKKTGSGAGIVARALRDLTGQDLSTAAEWRSFWAAHGATFELPRDGRAEGQKEARARGTAARFFGRTLDSDRIVFVIDISGSMKAKDPAPSGGRPQTGGEDSPYATDSRVRIDRAKAELAKAISALPPHASFTIVAYSGPVMSATGEDAELRTWTRALSGNLLRASEANVKRALAFVQALEAKGETFTGHAVTSALLVEGVDLIVLLSDGFPEEWVEDEDGKRRALARDEVRARIRSANRFARVTIDTFGFEGKAGSEPFVEFMKGVAADSGGVYQAID